MLDLNGHFDTELENAFTGGFYFGGLNFLVFFALLTKTRIKEDSTTIMPKIIQILHSYTMRCKGVNEFFGWF